jgi:hypothetical protein
MTTIEIPNNYETLCAGYRWGVHWSHAGASGWYIIRDADGEAIQGVERGDMFVTDEEEEEDGGNGCLVTEEEMEERIDAAFAAHDEARRVEADLVLVEVMPAHLRASHEAAGNAGSYPANGAVRFLVGRKAAESATNEWVCIIRASRPADVGQYAIDVDGDRI